MQHLYNGPLILQETHTTMQGMKTPSNYPFATFKLALKNRAIFSHDHLLDKKTLKLSEITDKNIKVSFFKSSENTQKNESGPVCTVSNNKFTNQ